MTRAIKKHELTYIILALFSEHSILWDIKYVNKIELSDEKNNKNGQLEKEYIPMG